MKKKGKKENFSPGLGENESKENDELEAASREKGEGWQNARPTRKACPTAALLPDGRGVLSTHRPFASNVRFFVCPSASTAVPSPSPSLVSVFLPCEEGAKNLAATSAVSFYNGDQKIRNCSISSFYNELSLTQLAS